MRGMAVDRRHGNGKNDEERASTCEERIGRGIDERLRILDGDDRHRLHARRQQRMESSFVSAHAAPIARVRSRIRLFHGLILPHGRAVLAPPVEGEILEIWTTTLPCAHISPRCMSKKIDDERESALIKIPLDLHGFLNLRPGESGRMATVRVSDMPSVWEAETMGTRGAQGFDQRLCSSK